MDNEKVICDMCEAENDADSTNCKMCKRELKGAIRTVAGSMPAAAINEEHALAEFKIEAQFHTDGTIAQTNRECRIEQAARNLLHNQAQAIFADIRKKVSEHSDVVTNMHMMHENDIIELEKKWKASGK